MYNCVIEQYLTHWASQVVLAVKNLPTNAGDLRDLGSIPGQERRCHMPYQAVGGQKKKKSLEKEMEAHSNILAWEIPRTEEPGGLQSMRSQKSQTQLRD